MAHQRISEHRAKQLLSTVFGNRYTGVELDRAGHWRKQLETLPSRAKFVLKVDQAVKGRYKQGLVALNLTSDQVAATADTFFAQGFQYLLVEPYHAYDSQHERYLALRRQRSGINIMYAGHGGVDVEQSPGSVNHAILRPASAAAAARTLGLPAATLAHLQQMFEDQHLSFLEINPLVVENGRAQALDAAAVADDAATGLGSTAWSSHDFRQPAGRVTPAEEAVAELDSYTPSSFSLKVLNPDGQIFVLLSGGGASLVVVDEVCHQGAGRLLANYGEYSGDPSTGEVHAYARHIVDLLLRSRGRPKVLLIAGGVANFTDIRTTFEGLTMALSEHLDELRSQKVKVFVRRGGPGAGVAVPKLERFLASERLLGGVWGPEQPLARAVSAALQSLTKVEAS